MMRTVAHLVILTALLVGCRDGSGAARPAARGEAASRHRVEIGTVEREVVPRLITVVGAVYARERVTVRNEVPGTVGRLRADFGDIVEAGQVLLELDRRELELHVGAARAALAEAEAGRVRAYAAWQRAQQLYPQEVISKERRDAVEAEFRASEASREAAAKQLALAEKKLGDATVRAPFRAAIQARHVSPGQYVPAYTELFELVAIDHVKFRGEVPERVAPRLHEGLTVRLEVDSLPGEVFEGTVTRVASALTAATRSLPFESEIPNPAGKLAPGMFARVRIGLDPEPILLMPRAALVDFAGVQRAFVVRDGRAESRTIDIGSLVEDRIEVVSGLAAGERVVVTGQEWLEDGMAVSTMGDGSR